MTGTQVTVNKALKESACKSARIILFCTLILIAIGWVMLLDTGLVFEGQANTAHFHNLIFKRLLCTFAGFGILGLLWIVDNKYLRLLTLPAIGIGLISLALVLSPYGVEERGSQRWLEIFGFRFQPIEFVKLAIVWFLADQLARTGPLSRTRMNRLLFPGIVILTAISLVALQPNLSGAIFIMLLAFSMAWLGGINGRIALSLTGGAAVALAAMLALNPDRIARFLPVFRPLSDLNGAGYQVGLSIWAVTSGGFLGRGPGGSIAMYSLPDHTTDFIFSIISEEWGFIGGLVVVILLAAMVYHSFRLSLAQEDSFRLLFGCGIATIIGLQAAINIGVALGMLPTTGMPLPFLSSGGTNLVLSLVEVGLLLNLSQTAGTRVCRKAVSPLKLTRINSGSRQNRTRRSVIDRNYRPAGINMTGRKRRVASR
jgi:cell division protein FtsW